MSAVYKIRNCYDGAVLTLLLSVFCSPALAAVAVPGGAPIMPQGRAVGVPGTAAAPFDYKAAVELDADALREAGRLERVSRELFEAYIAREVRPIFRGVARAGFERALPWNAAFARDRFDNLELSFAQERLFRGRATFVSRTKTRYKGRTVEFLRFMHGAGAATAVRVDGRLVTDERGEPYLWYASDKESFDAFARWFDRALTPAEK